MFLTFKRPAHAVKNDLTFHHASLASAKNNKKLFRMFTIERILSKIKVNDKEPHSHLTLIGAKNKVYNVNKK